MDARSGTRGFWLLAALGAALTGAGLLAAHYLDEHGHVVTGMDNQVVWGLPHVFAIFMIVAASGVLNVASVGSVFGHAPYKARARLAGLLSLALLAGGLLVLVLDLGRPDRVLVAATNYNFRSMFAWNVFLYTGLAAVVVVYLWTLFAPAGGRWSRPVGIAVLVWRIVLTTGTGSIFAFLVARQAFGSALLGPLFVVLSFGWGLAVFLIAQAALEAAGGRATPPAIRQRLTRLLGLFVAASLFLVAVLHLSKGYFAQQQALQAFLLRDGGVLTLLFWGGYVLAGSLLPLALAFGPRSGEPRVALLAAIAVVAGAFAWLFAFLVGGQAFPLELFPGWAASSSFGDGRIAHYAPAWPEWLLGVGGVGAACLITVVGAHLLDFEPADDAVGVH